MDDSLSAYVRDRVWLTISTIRLRILFNGPPLQRVSVSSAMVSLSKHQSFPSRSAGGIHSVDSAFQEVCRVDSRFRGNDCDLQRPFFANDTSTPTTGPRGFQETVAIVSIGSLPGNWGSCLRSPLCPHAALSDTQVTQSDVLSREQISLAWRD